MIAANTGDGDAKGTLQLGPLMTLFPDLMHAAAGIIL